MQQKHHVKITVMAVQQRWDTPVIMILTISDDIQIIHTISDTYMVLLKRELHRDMTQHGL